MKKYSIYVLFVLILFLSNNNNINYHVDKKNYSESLNNTFEDDNFYKCIIDSYNNVNNLNITYDTILSDEELSQIITLNCNGKDKNEDEKIKSIRGINKLINLSSLNLNYNYIKDLDISGNANLTKIFIEGNEITKLDTSLNNKVKTIYAINNNISDINISNNNNLNYLALSNNNISSIDLSDNVNLSYIDLENNNLNSINLNNNPYLTMVFLTNNKLDSIDISKNLYIETLQLSSNNIEYIDISNNSRLRYLYINNNKLTDIKFGNNIQLNYLYLYDNSLNSLDISSLSQINRLGIDGNNNLTNLNISNTLINELKLEDLENLISLNANTYFLKNLIIKGSSKLNKIELGNNIVNLNIDKSDLKNVILDNCKDISTLIIDNSKLSDINLSNNINLTKLSLENNNLSCIDLSNNGKLMYINLKNNNFSKNMEPLLINSLLNLEDLDDMVKLPNSITDLSSDIILSNNLNINNNVIKIINGGKATININKFKYDDNTDINYKLMYFIDTVNISSEKYNLKKDYLYVGNDSDEEIKKNIITDYAVFEINDNILYVKYAGQVLKSYPLIRFNIDNYDILNNSIVIENDINYSDFISNINIVNGSYKIFDVDNEITDGNINSNMKLKIYYNDEEIYVYNIMYDKIDLSNLNIKNNKYIICNISKVNELLSKVNNSYDVIITDKDNNVLGNDDYIKTGDKIKISLSNTSYSYIIVVMGDVTGSGNIFIGDISKLYRYYKGLITLEEPYVIAGDVTYDGVIEINDIAKLYQYYKGIIKTLE